MVIISETRLEARINQGLTECCSVVKAAQKLGNSSNREIQQIMSGAPSTRK